MAAALNVPEAGERLLRDAQAKLDRVESAAARLSGGERQRVHLARVLAQIWNRPDDGGRYLLLDEPLAAQDLGRQHEIMAFLRVMAAEGVGILVVVHDLNVATRYSDELLLMRQGASVAVGSPGGMLTQDRIRSTFEVESVVVPDPISGTPMVVPTGPAALSTAASLHPH